MGFEKRSAFDQGFVDGYEAYMEKVSGAMTDAYKVIRSQGVGRLRSAGRVAKAKLRMLGGTVKYKGRDVIDHVKRNPKKYMAVGGAAAAGGGYAAGRRNR